MKHVGVITGWDGRDGSTRSIRLDAARAIVGTTGTTRRRLLGIGVAGLAAPAALGLAACGAAGPSGAGEAPPAASRQPVTIDILTRPGVASPTGHSQWYAQVAKNSFTPQTNITVNLFDGDPNVTTKLSRTAPGSPPALMAQAAARRRRTASSSPWTT
jgi:hypothetical protein